LKNRKLKYEDLNIHGDDLFQFTFLKGNKNYSLVIRTYHKLAVL